MASAATDRLPSEDAQGKRVCALESLPGDRIEILTFRFVGCGCKRLKLVNSVNNVPENLTLQSATK